MKEDAEQAAAHYLRDLGREIVALGSTPGADDEGFEAGRRMALYEVLTLMLSQADAFGFAAADVGLDGVDPARFLPCGCADLPLGSVPPSRVPGSLAILSG